MGFFLGCCGICHGQTGSISIGTTPRNITLDDMITGKHPINGLRVCLVIAVSMLGNNTLLVQHVVECKGQS